MEKLLGKIVVQARGGSVGDAAASAKAARKIVMEECMVAELNCLVKARFIREEERV